jgi:hypothetical protein
MCGRSGVCALMMLAAKSPSPTHLLENLTKPRVNDLPRPLFNGSPRY